MSELVTPTLDEEKAQPTMLAVKTACLLFPGAVVTFRAFKQSTTRSLRGIADAEFHDAIKDLENNALGTIRKLRIPRTTNLVTVFVKNDPERISWPSNFCTQTEYRQRYNLAAHRSITPAIKRALENNGYVPDGFFDENV